jgi:2-polyprenyl-3-methyl-5-hydroxy-6-metoxy-1,4-benzoquinol methylase
MICKYCQIIHSFDDSYPLREATRNVESDFPRCDWHWRFVCSVCGIPRHFNGITWCEKTQRFVCLSCAKSNKAIRRKFWKWEYYYAIECDVCGKTHPALDYLEFLGKHPWQLHADMQKKRVGLDPNFSLPEDTSVSVPLEKAVISDKQISQAWDKLADKWANRFTEHGDMNRKYIIDPTLFRLMGKVKGLSILDAGCGHGYLCRLLAKKGANMVGVDLSKSFIEMARQKEKAAPLGITYYHRSLSDLAIFQNETFDMVVSNLALMDVLDQKKAIGELHRVLKKNGRLIFSIMHPCFSSSPVHGWVRVPKDSQRKEDWIYWKVDRYFDRSMEIWQLAPGWPSTYSFHYPLSDYVKTLIQNGFTITNFEEPVPSKKAMKEHHRELGNECDRIPWFLIIGAKKT